MITIVDALHSLRPKSEWAVSGNNIEWLDESQTKPTETEIQAEVARLQAEYEANEYQRQRATAYPSIADQLDTLYHQGYDGWKATITAVKEEFPKP